MRSSDQLPPDSPDILTARGTLPPVSPAKRYQSRIKNVLLFILCCMAPFTLSATTFEQALVSAALERTRHSVRYDGSYVSIGYPGGDVPADMGVCTDVLIRSYRKLGIDLQRLVHEDMQENFDAYPSNRIWGLTRPDSNIDHRRVPNLQKFFTRKGRILQVSDTKDAYLPGDIVTWKLPGNLPHIGIVSDRLSEDDATPLIVHNIGSGPKLENMLFSYPITGHYRYQPQ